MALTDEATKAGARQSAAAASIGLSVRTCQRWMKHNGGDDSRHGPRAHPGNRLSDEERQRVLEIANQPEFRELAPVDGNFKTTKSDATAV